MSLRSLIPFGRDPLPMRSEGDLFTALHRDVDRLFEGMMTSHLAPLWADRSPRVDVRETEKGLEVTAELPGVDEKDVDITLDEGMLTIRGEKKMSHETGEAAQEALGLRVSERAYGSFVRTVPVPFEIEDDGVSASFDKGVLKVTLPRSAKAKEKSRKIPLTQH